MEVRTPAHVLAAYFATFHVFNLVFTLVASVKFNFIQRYFHFIVTGCTQPPKQVSITTVFYLAICELSWNFLFRKIISKVEHYAIVSIVPT